MRTTSPEGTQSVSPPGLQRLFRFGASCFIVVGGHPIVVEAAALAAYGWALATSRRGPARSASALLDGRST